MKLSFFKMHGLGNDFVVFDARLDEFTPSERFLKAVADRKRGAGCDQIVVLRQPRSPDADIWMDIYNSDGSTVRACGNASRCVAQFLFAELGRDSCTLETVAGLLPSWQEREGVIAVDFGEPRLDWKDIPLSREADTLHAPVTAGNLMAPVCVNVGNPHAVFFVPDVTKVQLSEVGPKLENDPIFPDRCNIEIAQILSPTRIRMRVWERGAGITDACGSGACATLIASVRRGLTARRCVIVLDGGELEIEWREDNHVIMMGSASLSYEGTFDASFWLGEQEHA